MTTMDELNESELAKEVSKYSVLMGFTLLIVFVVPCVTFALFSKYCQKQPLRRKATYDFAEHPRTTRRGSGTLRYSSWCEANPPTKDGASSMDVGAFGQIEMPLDKIKCIDKMAPMGMSLSCTETWQAYAPVAISKDKKQLITIKKIVTAEGAKGPHSSCLRSELDVIARVPAHPHILNLLGVCTNGGNAAALLLEFPPYGSLHSFLIAKAKAKAQASSEDAGFWSQLRKARLEEQCLMVQSEGTLRLPEVVHDSVVRSRPFRDPLDEGLTETDRLIFSVQLASGMEHLTSSGILHGRLSTENVLVSAGFYLKLGGMEFTTNLLHRSNTHTRLKRTHSGRNLFKWEAPEVMGGEEPTAESEVWRFGMVMWEVASMGDTPFTETPNRSLVELVKQGQRPLNPQGTSQQYYNLMLDCWSTDPAHRPTFTDIVGRLRDMLTTACDSRSEAIPCMSRPVQLMLANRGFAESFSPSPASSPSPPPVCGPPSNLLFLRKHSLRRVSGTDLFVVSESPPELPEALPRGYSQTDV